MAQQLTILTSEEMAELQELVDESNSDMANGMATEAFIKVNRIAEILGLEVNDG